jgi:hypothetical protein
VESRATTSRLDLLKSSHLALEVGDDAGVAGAFGVPASGGGVVVEGCDVVESVLELGAELDG